MDNLRSATARLLIIDDDDDARGILFDLLKREGYDLKGVSSGEMALAILHKEPVDCLITDVRMPGISGVELLKRVKQSSPDIPVILITGYGDVNIAVEAMRLGAHDFLLKPITLERLSQSIRHALSEKKKALAGGLSDHSSSGRVSLHNIVTQNPALKNVLALAKKVALSDVTVLIQGETGTGKELMAQFIHRHSRRNDGVYVAMNCAALPEQLAETELFGHEKGAFTGAISKKIGKFEQAHQGTLVLDEVSEMPITLQSKLLRALQENEIDRVGGTKTIPVDVRVIAISNVSLKKAVSDGRFREDLYYRLNVMPLFIPPLRERIEDIKLLADYFAEKYSEKFDLERRYLDESAVARLKSHSFSGNVREMENIIQRAILIANSTQILAEHIILDEKREPDGKISHLIQSGTTVRDMEKHLIMETLRASDNNRTHAAKLLGISIRTLRNKLREYRNDVLA